MNSRAERLMPFLKWMRQSNVESLRADAFAGFTNAAIVLPQGVAFAVIAGLPPEYGLYTAMITAVIAALFGSSMVMVSGPTTAISAVFFATLQPFAEPNTDLFVAYALLLTVMVGLVQIIAAVARLGAMVAFVSHSVMIGFTAAAAILIGVSQLAGVLGVEVEPGGTVVERVIRVYNAADSANIIAISIAAATFATLILVQRISNKLPGFLIALTVASLLGIALNAEEAGVRMVGALPSVVPSFQIPHVSLDALQDLTEGAIAIALIGLLEAISIGRAFAMRRHERFDANQEILGQGLSNFIGGFFQAYAGSGSFTRSGVNEESGARTPFAAIFSSVFLALLLLLVTPYVALIPTPGMAALILFVAYKLINQREIHHILDSSYSETVILGITFAAGLLIELDFAIYLGVIASLLVFLNRTAHPSLQVGAPQTVNGERKFVDSAMEKATECPQISIIRLDGTLYFGSVEQVEKDLRSIEETHPQLLQKLLVLKGVGNVDLAGADLIIDEAKSARETGGDFRLICNFPPLVNRLKRLHVINEIGEENLHPNKSAAIAAAVKAADDSICQNCRARVFHECAVKAGAREAMRDYGY